ncbi:MAG: MerR family transcriptional regulator [Clostridia bacterium]
MKINEVEMSVGITKKNIRFYETEGLLSPQRNSENGYRDYSEVEIRILKQIKLLRKLGFPLEEIRKMQSGILTVTDGMYRHRVLLVRESKNINQSIEFCDRLSSFGTKLEDLDADTILKEMESLENMGTTFQNNYETDRKKSKLSSIIISAIVILIMLIGTTLAVFEMFASSEVSPISVVVITLISAVIILSVVFVLFARLKEITRGEIEKSKKY